MTEPAVSFEERKWTHELEIERQKWLFETNRDDAHREHDKGREFHTYINKSAMEGANLALKTLVLINGGAAVAILTFLGALAGKDKADFAQIGIVAYTLRYYATGVALAVAGMAFAYLTQYCAAVYLGTKTFHYDHPFIRETERSRTFKRLNILFHVLSFACALISLSAFIVGMWTTSDRVTKIIETRPTSAIVAD
jgi:hypothetical protein